MSEEKKEVIEEITPVVPTYKFSEEEGMEELPPVKRQIAKSMEVTEMFTYYDALAYMMRMEKAIEDKKVEIGTLETMVGKYKEELDIIDGQFNINEMEKTFQLELHEKLKKEEAEKEDVKEE